METEWTDEMEAEWQAIQAEQWEKDMAVMRQTERRMSEFFAFPDDRYGY